MFISQPLEELQDWNLEFKLIPPKYFDGNYFGTMSAILDFFKEAIAQLFKELQIWNLNGTYFDLFELFYLFDLFWHTWTYLTYFDLFWTIWTYFDLFDIFWPILTYFDVFDLFWPMGPILINWACLVWHLLLWKRVAKSLRAWRRGMEHSELLVLL